MTRLIGYERSHSRFEQVIIFWSTTCAVLTSLLLFVSLLIWGNLDAIDRAVLIGLHHETAQPGTGWVVMKEAMLVATAIGAFPTLAMVVGAVACLFIANGRRGLAVRLVLVAGIGIAAANLVKLVVDRARPDVVPHWIAVSSLSFPSGHTTDGSLVYLLLAILAAGATSRRSARIAGELSAFLLIAAIGVSRVYLGVHWPSDVLAGWALGGAWAFFTAPILRRAYAQGPRSSPSA